MSDQGKHASTSHDEIAGMPVQGGLHLPDPAQGDQQVLDLINFLEWLDEKVVFKSNQVPVDMTFEDVAKQYLAERSG